MEEEKLITIDVREIAMKCKTKGEVYKVLTTTGELYLQPIDQVNWDYIRDIISGDKQVSYNIYSGVHSLKLSQDNRSTSHWGAAHTRDT